MRRGNVKGGKVTKCEGTIGEGTIVEGTRGEWDRR